MLCMGHRDRYMDLRLNMEMEQFHREHNIAFRWPRGELMVDPQAFVLFSSDDDSSGASRPEDA